MRPPKPKKIGRPILPKGVAKGQIIPVRFDAATIKQIGASAKAQKRTVSEWIRSVVASAIEA